MAVQMDSEAERVVKSIDARDWVSSAPTINGQLEAAKPGRARHSTGIGSPLPALSFLLVQHLISALTQLAATGCAASRDAQRDMKLTCIRQLPLAFFLCISVPAGCMQCTDGWCANCHALPS